jgi:His-Xaa-Ser system protein HxsD
MTRIEGIPSEVASVDLDAGAVHLEIDASIYPLPAVYSASYVFLDRAYVFLDKPRAEKDGPEKLRIVLSPKTGAFDADRAKAMAGELANELLSAAWRHQITKENRATIEAVTMQAIAGAMGSPSLDDLEDFDFTEEPFDDPLGIAQSWEEKYTKKKEEP